MAAYGSESGSAAPDPLAAIWAEVRGLGLTAHVADLDAHGFTVIPPELASPNGLAERLLTGVLDVAERRNGVRPDLETGGTHAGYSERFAEKGGDSPFGELLNSLILEGRVFEEALMNPVVLAITTYLCGYGVVLSSMGCFLKGPNKTPVDLHCDTLLPSPYPHEALVCNATYLLTDFSRENGSTAFVPGSHKWCRAPRGEEGLVEHNPQAVAVEAPAGSLVVWHGNTWHGAFPRAATGLRVSIPVLMARPFMRTEEDLADHVPEETLARNSPRFAILVQQGIVYGWRDYEHAPPRARRAHKYLRAYQEECGGLVSLDPLRMHLYG